MNLSVPFLQSSISPSPSTRHASTYSSSSGTGTTSASPLALTMKDTTSHRQLCCQAARRNYDATTNSLTRTSAVPYSPGIRVGSWSALHRDSFPSSSGRKSRRRPLLWALVSYLSRVKVAGELPLHRPLTIAPPPGWARSLGRLTG